MKFYLGVGGQFLHDAGLTLLDEKGNIHAATLSERISGIKHDSLIYPEVLKDYLTRHPNTELVSNDDWKARDYWRGQLVLQKQLHPRWFDKERPIWSQHPAIRENRHTEHHIAHAAAAFSTRPDSFDKEDCVMVVIDGIGEHRSCVIYNHNFETVHEVFFPKSLGYLYANFTDRLPGMHLKSNNDEYVVMGLSCYGDPVCWEEVYEMFTCIPCDDVPERNIMTNDMKNFFINKLCDRLLEHKNEDAAASLQRMTEEVILDIMKVARKYGSKLCYSGGVAQNIMANTRFDYLFDDVWVDVNPGDGGASLGAAAYAYMQDTGSDRINWTSPFLGHEIKGDLDHEKVVDYLLKNKVAGVANGKSEFSYRAYGNRSLLGDVRYDVKDTVNTIKQRQLYRPFAPAILEEHAGDYFEGKMNRWMQYTAKAKHEYTSVTHVDGTGRVQLVPEDSPSNLRRILEIYYEKTGVPMLLNTSLNIRGKPMVDTVDHAVEFEKKYGVKVFTT